MPVSTFSPAHSVRSRGPLISRWNTTRERIDADEQRISMQELDGTGLYDRPDWPLSLAAAAGTPEERRRKRGRQYLDPADLQDDRVDEGAVLRRLEDISPTMAILRDGAYTTDPEVSDMEDDDDDYADSDYDSDSMLTTSPPRPTQSHPLSHSHTYSSSSSTASESSRGSRSSVHGSRREQHADVSPVREEPNAGSRVVRDATTAGLSNRAASEVVLHLPHDDGQESDEDGDWEESRDIARPLSYATSSPVVQQGATPTSTPPLHLNRATFSALTNSPLQHSSVRESMHGRGDRRLSKRSSTYSTTQIPHQRERVRYSWQSIQEDEPNRPRIHVIKLFSQSVTASAGFPTGEAFGFSISAGARRIAVYNSARLYVLQTNALPVGISQDYALKRRPLDVDLTDEGNTLAILADDHTINVYELGHELRRTKTIALDFPAHRITLAPTGGLLAAAYEGGIEVFSLHASALDTDRRAVRCARVDRMTFSEDGSTLLGTTTRVNVSWTVTISVPVFPAEDHPTYEELKEAWCSELLHPENIRNSSHATFMRENRKTCNDKVFAWNGLEDTFGILNIGDMTYGNVDFPVVISPPLSTCGGLGAAIHSCPSVNEHGDIVAMVVNDRTIRLYIVPRETGDDRVMVEAHSIDHELDEGYGCPFSEVRWVHSSASLPAPRDSQSSVQGRLVVTSPGGVLEPGIGEDSVEDIEGGRIIIFDFDAQFAGQPGQTFNLTLGKSPPTPLDEEKKSMHEQVNLVRRRTVNQSKSSALNQRPTPLGRSATTHGNRSLRRAEPMPVNTPRRTSRNSMLSIGSIQSDGARSLPDLLETVEATDEVLEDPYVQGQPRSHASLQRAASNAQRHRFQTLEERNQAHVSVDSNAGFLSLPEYTEEPNAPLPSRFRAMAGLDAPTVFDRPKPTIITNIDGGTAGPSSAIASSVLGPYTAPPDVGDGFSADLAFQAANAEIQSGAEIGSTDEAREQREIRRKEIEQQGLTPTEPESPAFSTRSSMRSTLARMDSRQLARLEHLPRGNGTNSASSTYSPRSYSPAPLSAVSAYGGSFGGMPRSLQRAYSNAVSPLVTGTSPAMTSDWQNMSPVIQPATSTTGHLDNEDAISPVNTHQHTPFNPYRFSTPSKAVHRHRPSTATVATMPAIPSEPMPMMPARRMPPHMQAFRAAAAANASASLFPSGQPRDHVPIRPPTVHAGTASHPITAWHPPAPSASAPQLSRSKSSKTIRGFGHSRNNSFGAKSTYPSTEKAKKLGFFRKQKKTESYVANGSKHWEDSAAADMRSVMTWESKKERAERCSVM